MLFFGTSAILLVAAVAAVFAITPRYTAEARVMIDAREENVVGIQAVLSGLAADDPTIRSEIEVLRSEDLARRVIAQTDLDQSREFNPILSPSFVSHVLQSVDWPWLNAAFGEILMDRGEALRNSEVRAEVVAAYFDRLAVETLWAGTRASSASPSRRKGRRSRRGWRTRSPTPTSPCRWRASLPPPRGRRVVGGATSRGRRRGHGVGAGR